jgi:hypothetical protein
VSNRHDIQSLRTGLTSGTGKTDANASFWEIGAKNRFATVFLISRSFEGPPNDLDNLWRQYFLLEDSWHGHARHPFHSPFWMTMVIKPVVGKRRRGLISW